MQFPAHLNLTAICREGRLKEVLHILLTTHIPPVDSNTYLQVLHTCIAKNALPQGKQFHSFIIAKGFEFAARTFFQNKLIDMYLKCGSLVDARKVFNDMTKRDGFSWNVMIAAYRRHGYPHEALTLFHQMQQTGLQPDQFTFASVLPACAKIGALEQGMDIHQSIMERGFWSDVVVASALVDMYAKCGCIQKARELFDKISQRDTVAWNAMIAGYAQNGVLDEALRLFKKMPQRDMFSWNAMITGYAQNGVLDKALKLFKQMPRPDVVSWNAMIAGYAQNGALDKALRLFNEMPRPDVVSWNAIIAGHAQNGVFDKALSLFKDMPGRDVASWNAMIAGYAKSGALDEAFKLFEEMPQRNVVSWTAMIAGYAQNGLVEKALQTFKQMQLAGVKPNSTTFACILPACAKMGALDQGMDIHQSIIGSNFFSDVVVGSALVDMYAKCGSITKARKVFDKMSQRDTVSWNAMIAGYAMHGFREDALKLFELMKYSGTDPDHVSFICVLFSCSHAGLVDEGCKYFNDMTDVYCIISTMDHYVCMVDLLGRAGYLGEALNFIIKMPIKPAVVVWMCLLGACKSHKNIRLGLFTTTLLFEQDPKNGAPYVLLSNIYADVGRWGDVQKVRRLMKDKGVKKIPGYSWIEVHKMVQGSFCRRRIKPTKT